MICLLDHLEHSLVWQRSALPMSSLDPPSGAGRHQLAVIGRIRCLGIGSPVGKEVEHSRVRGYTASTVAPPSPPWVR